MPCVLLVKSNGRKARGVLEASLVTGKVACVLSQGHVWNPGEQSPTFVTFELDCTPAEARAAFLVETPFIIKFDLIPIAARTHCIENPNSSVGNGQALRWSEMRVAFETRGVQPSIPSLDASTLPARPSGGGLSFDAQMLAAKGEWSIDPLEA